MREKSWSVRPMLVFKEQVSMTRILTWEVTDPRSAPYSARILCFYIDALVFHLPVKCSRFKFLMTAPKSTSDEGTEMGWIEID